MGYQIYLSNQKGDATVRLPVLPSELPEVSYTSNTEDFLAVKGGHYTVIGKISQPSVSVEHMLPGKGKKLSFAVSKTKGSKVVSILKEATNKAEPIRYTVAKDEGGYYINRLFAVSSFSYHVDKKNDYIVGFELIGWKKYGGWKAENKKISITPTKATIKTGKTKTAKLKNVSAKAKIKWSSDKKSVATVSSKGVIAGRSKGKATISATYKKKTYKCEVSVK
jgi:hypothetical protein